MMADILEIDFYAVLDINEIDGNAKDVQIDAHNGNGAPDGDWNDVINHTQFLPAGDYLFTYDFQVQSTAPNKNFFVRAIESVELPILRFHIERDSGHYQHYYGFPISWDGGDFTFHLQMARNSTDFELMCQFSDFTMTRRS